MFSVKRSGYNKEVDSVYTRLLALACYDNEKTVNNNYSKDEVVYLLNCLPDYYGYHWRLIPILKAIATDVGVFDNLTVATRDLLTKDTQKGIVREIAKEKQLKEVISLFTQHGIKMILLKGTAFSNYIYSNSNPRLTNDVDILVLKGDVNRALNLLGNSMEYREKRVPGLNGDLYEVSFVPKGKIGMNIDLHTALSDERLFDINYDDVWETSIEHPFYGNENIRTLNPEYSIIHQAIHSFKNVDFVNYNIVDSSRIISKLEVDQVALLEISTKTSTLIPVLTLLHYMNYHTGLILINNKLSLKYNYALRYRFIHWLLCSIKKQSNSKRWKVKCNQAIAQFLFLSPVSRVLKYQLSYIFSYLMHVISKK